MTRSPGRCHSGRRELSRHEPLRHHRPLRRRRAVRPPRVVRGARRSGVHRRLVSRGRRERRLHPAGARRRVGADAAPRSGHRASLHQGPGAAGPDRRPRWPKRLPGGSPLGLGASSEVIVEQWNGIAFDEPYRRVRDTVRFLRGRVPRREGLGDRHRRGARLPSGRPPATLPPSTWRPSVPGMLRLAGREADGAVLNWLSAEDVATAVREVGPGQGDRRRGSSWSRTPIPRRPARWDAG